MQIGITINHTFGDADALIAFAAKLKTLFAEFAASAVVNANNQALAERNAETVSRPAVTADVATQSAAAGPATAEAHALPDTASDAAADTSKAPAKRGRKSNEERAALAAALAARTTDAVAVEPATAQTVVTTTVKTQEVTPAPGQPVTVDMVRAAASILVDMDGGEEALRAILTSVGAPKIGELKPEQTGTALSAINARIAGTSAPKTKSVLL